MRYMPLFHIHLGALLALYSGCDPGSAVAPSLQELPEDSGPLPAVSEDSAAVEYLGDACDGIVHQRVVINELVASNLDGPTDLDEETPDWIELANLGDAVVDLSGWGLSDDPSDPLKWVFPQVSLEPGGIVLVFASGKDLLGEELHTNFSVSAYDPVVQLAAPDACPVDYAHPERLRTDISFGRVDDNPDIWGYYLDSTPGLSNTTESRPGFAPTPSISPASGFYREPITATVSDEEDGAIIRVTLDGAEPDVDCQQYQEPLALDATQQPIVLRAVAWVDGLWPSPVATATFSQDPGILDYGLKVVSLAVDPFDLYDQETGIYTAGVRDYETSYPYFGANFWEDWERNVHIQVWEPGGELVIDQDAGIKIHGGYTRAFRQKSFRIIARAGYGPDALDYKFFPNEDLDSFKKIVLEGAGDWCPTHTENSFVDQVFRDENGVRYPTMDSQAWEPTVVYLNGEFWGLYAFREKLDEYYIQAHHGADPDNLDRIECTADADEWWNLNQGTWDAFNTLNKFVEEHDLAQPEAWAWFKSMVDIENLATAVLAEGYWGNTDWWNNNLRMWRERVDDGPFRWMVFDLGHSWPSWSYDHIGVSVHWSGTGLPIGDAMANEEFRVLLANQASDFLNTSLAVDNALAVLDSMHARIEPVIPEQYARWCGSSPDHWYSLVDYAREFVQERPEILKGQIIDHLGLSGSADLTLLADPPEAGSFHLTVADVDPPFTGFFFTGIPISLTAVPTDGWEFTGWSDPELGDQAQATLVLRSARSVTAYFQ